MTDGFWQVATGALDQSQVRDANHGRLTDINAVGKDQSFRIHCTNSSDERLDDLDVAFLEIAFVRSHFWRFVDEIETKLRIRNPLVAFGKRLPMVYGSSQSLVALGSGSGEEIRRLQLTFIDAIAGNAMEVNIDVNAMLASQFNRSIYFLQ